MVAICGKKHDSLSVCPVAACHCVLTTNLILCLKFHLRDIRHDLDEGAWLVNGDKSNMGNVVLHYRGAELRVMNAYTKLQDPEFSAPNKCCIQRLVLYSLFGDVFKDLCFPYDCL